MKELNEDLLEYFYEGFISLINKLIYILHEKGTYSQNDISKIIDNIVDIHIENTIIEYGKHPEEVFEIRQNFSSDPIKSDFLSNIENWISSFLDASKQELHLNKKNEEKFISRALDFFICRILELSRVNNENSSLIDVVKELGPFMKNKRNI